MQTYDVIIIGGGAAGMQCALVLGSAMAQPWGLDKSILLLDDNRSDIRSAIYNNVLGVQTGVVGEKLLNELHEQLAQYSTVTYEKKHIASAAEEADAFVMHAKDGTDYHGKKLVLATGFNQFTIDGLGVTAEDNVKSYKPQKVQLQHTNFLIRQNLYVVGLLAAGVSSQYAAAAGSGAQVAADIMAEWAGENVVIHDKPAEA